jgi:O-antigen/teichoic acid export membrane protein
VGNRVESPVIDEPRPDGPTASRGVRMSRALGVHDAGRVLRDFLTYLPAQVLPSLAAGAALLLLTRRLLPTPYGVLQLALQTMTAGGILVSQWLTGAITRELPEARARDDLAGFVHTLRRALLASVGIFAVIVVALLVAAQFNKTINGNVWLIALGIVGIVLQNVAVTLFSSALRPKAYAVALFLSRVGGICIGLWLVFNGQGVTEYLLALGLTSTVVGAVALVIGMPHGHGKPKEVHRVRSWAAYGIPAGLSGLVAWAMVAADRYLLAALRSTAEAGVYTLGATIGSQAVTIPALAFMTGARPLAVRAHAEKGRAEVERLMTAWTRIVLLMSVPAVGFLAVTSVAILRFGPGSQRGTVFFPAVNVIPIVALGTAIYVLGTVAGLGFIVERHSSALIATAAVGLAVNVLANLALIPRYGSVGAAIALPLGSLGYLAATEIWARRYARWYFPWGTLARTCVATGAAMGVAHLSYAVLPGPLTQARAGEEISLALVVGVATYMAVLALVGELRRVPATAQ